MASTPNSTSSTRPWCAAKRDYEPAKATAFWRQLLPIARVFEEWRAGFGGKSSLVQLFWGSMDLSCVRFSGRPAPEGKGTPPPNCPSWVMTEAESRENSSAGFWAGGSDEGTFYAYALPVPDGYNNASISVGHFDEKLGEFVLPYADVRTSADPAATLLAFLNETYALAADLAKWDRPVLDLNPHRLDAEIYHSDRPSRRPS